MVDMIWVKPVAGCTVMEPASKLVMPERGMFIAVGDPHWAAHLRFGDIEVVEEPPAEHMEELEAMAKAQADAQAETKRLADEKLAADLQKMADTKTAAEIAASHQGVANQDPPAAGPIAQPPQA